MNISMPSANSASDRSIFPYLFLLAFAISLFGNVYQARNRFLPEQTLATTAATSRSMSGSHVGRIVDHLSVTSTSGATATLSFKGRKETILYIYSPSCHWCAANYASIIALARQRGSEYNFIGLSTRPDLAELTTYLNKHPYPFPSYVVRPDTDLAALGFSGTPQTLMLSRDGKIEHNWSGAYGQKTGADIQHFFSMTLPDISSSYGF